MLALKKEKKHRNVLASLYRLSNAHEAVRGYIWHRESKFAQLDNIGIVFIVLLFLR